MHVRTYVCTYVCMYVRMYEIYEYVHMYIIMYACVEFELFQPNFHVTNKCNILIQIYRFKLITTENSFKCISVGTMGACAPPPPPPPLPLNYRTCNITQLFICF